jgi:hypothetical protein
VRRNVDDVNIRRLAGPSSDHAPFFVIIFLFLRQRVAMLCFPSVGQPCRGISTGRRRVRVSTFADNGSPNTYMAFRQMSALTSTSKAFRARLQLRENEVPILQMWAARNCALHTCFGSDHGTILLIALRATPQTSASFARTLRNALRRTGVSTAGLRGHWLFLISEREAISVCVGNAELPPEPPRAVEQPR